MCITDIRYLVRELGNPLKIVRSKSIDIWFKSKEVYLIVFTTGRVKVWNLIETPIGWAICYPEIENLFWRCGVHLPKYFIHMKLSVEPITNTS